MKVSASVGLIETKACVFNVPWKSFLNTKKSVSLTVTASLPKLAVSLLVTKSKDKSEAHLDCRLREGRPASHVPTSPNSQAHASWLTEISVNEWKHEQIYAYPSPSDKEWSTVNATVTESKISGAHVSWASSVTSLYCSFITYETGKIVPTSQHSCEESMRYLWSA